MKLFKAVNERTKIQNEPVVERSGVLVVDDSRFSRNVLRDILKEEGYEVVGEAGDGLEAIEKAKELKPEFIFLDVEMPKLDGLGAIPLILANDPGINIIMCTALGQKKIIIEASKSGAKDYVIKPYRKENITNVLAILHKPNPNSGQVIPFQSGAKNGVGTDIHQEPKPVRESIPGVGSNSITESKYSGIEELLPSANNYIYREEAAAPVIEEILPVGSLDEVNIVEPEPELPSAAEQLFAETEEEAAVENAVLEEVSAEITEEAITQETEQDIVEQLLAETEEEITAEATEEIAIEAVEEVVIETAEETVSETAEEITIEAVEEIAVEAMEEIAASVTEESENPVINEEISETAEIVQETVLEELTAETAGEIEVVGAIAEAVEEPAAQIMEEELKSTEISNEADNSAEEISEPAETAAQELSAAIVEEAAEQVSEEPAAQTTEEAEIRKEIIEGEQLENRGSYGYLWMNRFTPSYDQAGVDKEAEAPRKRISMFAKRNLKQTYETYMGSTPNQKIMRYGMMMAYMTNDIQKFSISQPSPSMNLLSAQHEGRRLVSNLTGRNISAGEMSIADLLLNYDILTNVQEKNVTVSGLRTALEEMVVGKNTRELL